MKFSPVQDDAYIANCLLCERAKIMGTFDTSMKADARVVIENGWYLIFHAMLGEEVATTETLGNICWECAEKAEKGKL